MFSCIHLQRESPSHSSRCVVVEHETLCPARVMPVVVKSLVFPVVVGPKAEIIEQ